MFHFALIDKYLSLLQYGCGCGVLRGWFPIIKSTKARNGLEYILANGQEVHRAYHIKRNYIYKVLSHAIDKIAEGGKHDDISLNKWWNESILSIQY